MAGIQPNVQIHAILALLTAKHVLVAILVMGLGVDANQRA
jgi:hypothetical protein